MPSCSRTTDEPPSQPARKSQRTCSVAPVAIVRSVQVTPSPSCVKDSNATPQRASILGSARTAVCSTGSIITWLTRMAGSRGWVPSFRARIWARFWSGRRFMIDMMVPPGINVKHFVQLYST